ncbi:MAG: hypothetical protein Q9227_005409 [Pyrenula ochraceoflavens]
MEDLVPEAGVQNERKRKRSSEGPVFSDPSPRPVDSTINSSISYPVTNGHTEEEDPVHTKKTRLESAGKIVLPGDGPASVPLDRSAIPGEEMDLLFSAVPSVLIPGVPFAFFTPSFDYVTALTLRNTSPPPDKQLTKFYFQAHLDDTMQKFADVKAMGPAAADEWFKGLENTGKEKLADAARWEQWEASGGLHETLSWKDTQVEIRKHTQSIDQGPAVQAQESIAPSTATPVNQMPFTQTPSIQNAPSIGPPPTLPAKPQVASLPYNNFSFPPQPRPVQPLMPIQPHVPQQRAERSIKDVNEAKAARRAEIERRCQQLDPPIPPSVLVHMDAFAAAVQIPIPMNENAWEVLKPRLVAQREIAEQKEQEHRMQSQIVQRMTEERRQQEASLKEAKENLDREWDEVQKPVREKVNIYADEIIQHKWHGGNAVTKDLCPKFAADVLTYVRERFYFVQQQEDTMLLAAGRQPRQDPPNAAPTRSLILENMKSVFDAKVRPHTEHHQKEIFLCNGCDTTAKWYGFEGVVQHYAAKHTSNLSSGTIVVWWRAEWPETPPFNPNPTSSRGSYGAPNSVGSESTTGLPASALPVPHLSNNQRPYDHPPYFDNRPPSYPQYQAPQYGQNATNIRTESPASAAFQIQPQSSTYQFSGSPSIDYRNSTFPHDPRYPPYQANQQPYPPFGPYAQSQNFPPDPRSQPSYSYGQSHPPRASGPSFPLQNARPQIPATGFGAQAGLSAPGQPLGIYQVQLEELSRNAREVWEGTSSIQGLPSSVRIHVIIQHVVLRFKDRFTNEPNLNLFTEGLNSSSQMKPIRNLSDLTCKACSMTGGDLASFSKMNPQIYEAKLHTLPALLAHFQSVHIEQNRLQIVPQTGLEPPRLDWKFDMVQLPETNAIKDLISAPGMTNAKLSLIAAVLPGVFPTPLPRIESPPAMAAPSPSRPGPIPGQISTTNGTSSPHVPFSPAPRGGDAIPRQMGLNGIEVAVDDFPKFIESPTRDFTEPAEPAKEDEYDPHRPAYIEPPRDQFGRLEHTRSRHKQSPAQKAITQPSPREFAGNMTTAAPPLTDQKFNTPLQPFSNAQEDALSARAGSALQRNEQLPVTQPLKQEKTESMSAAEHFLNNFDPNDDRDEYRPLTDTAQSNQASSSGIRGLPRNSTPQRWISQRTSPTQEWERQELRSRYDERAFVPVPRYENDHDPRENEDFRYSRADPGYHEPRRVVESAQHRPDSRFDRYEAPRHSSQRPRSRSPHAVEAPQGATLYYRERSPPSPQYQRQSYPSHPLTDRNEYAVRENNSVTRLPAGRQYQYVEDNRFEEPYNGPVEYVRVAAREAPPSRYYIERTTPGAAGDPYHDYDRDYRREQVFEHNGQFYKRAPIADRQDPYAPTPRIRYV